MVLERVFPALPSTAGRGSIVATFPFEFQGEDTLQLTTIAVDATIVTVSWRMLQADGAIKVNQTAFPVPGGRLITRNDIPVGVGYVTNVLVRADISTQALGSLYARLTVARGTGDVAVPIGTLVQGFPCNEHALFWPGGQSLMPNEGPGFRQFQTQAAPVAGGQVVITVPLQALWRLRAIGIPFTAGAAGAARRPYLDFLAGLFPAIVRIPATVDCPATGTTVYCWAEGCNQDAAPRFVGPLATLPSNMYLTDQMRLQTAVENGQPDDQWGQPMFLYDEWLANG